MQVTAMDDIAVPECFLDGSNKNVSVEKEIKAISRENIEGLNYSQINAIDVALRASDSLVLLQGPPGTGKTYTISVLLKDCIVLVLELEFVQVQTRLSELLCYNFCDDLTKQNDRN